MLPAFLAFLFAAVIVLACLKGKMWVAALLSLLVIGLICKTIAAILAYALPKPAIILGANMPILPIGIGFLMLALAFLNIAFRNKQNEPPTDEQTFVRWILLGGGIAVPLMGYVYFSVAIYSPELLASPDPNPSLGVMVFIPVVLLGVILLYFASRMNRPQWPNLFRWIVFFYTNFLFLVVTAASLILIYAVPNRPLRVYPYWAAMLTTTFIPLGLLLNLLTRDYVTVRGTAPEKPKDVHPEPQTNVTAVQPKKLEPPRDVKTEQGKTMVVICKKCQARYRIPISKIPAKGVVTRCKKCQSKIAIRRPEQC